MYNTYIYFEQASHLESTSFAGMPTFIPCLPWHICNHIYLAEFQNRRFWS